MVIDSHWSLPRFFQDVELLDHLVSKWAQGREKGWGNLQESKGGECQVCSG